MRIYPADSYLGALASNPTSATTGDHYFNTVTNKMRVYNGSSWDEFVSGSVGDVTKVGTPANNQIGVWTGDGTIEGDGDFTWDETDLSVRKPSNDGNPRIRLGATDAEELNIQSVFDSGAQTLDYILFQSDAASAVANKGLFRFNVDGSNILDINDDGLSITGGLSLTGNVDGRDVAADGTKLDTVESNADVTDATNVAAAGAVMESDTSTALMSFVIDEDNLVSNLDTKVPTQQSVKAYVDGVVASSVNYQGGYNASTNTPDLDTSPSGISKGDMYTVTAAGNFFATAVEVGDVLIAEQDNPSVIGDWTIVNKDLDASSIKTSYESNSDTNAFTDTLKTKLEGINISSFGETLVDDANAAAARTTLGVDAAGTDNSTNVTLGGSLDYITIVGQVITRNAIDLSTDITGDLPIGNIDATGTPGASNFLRGDGSWATPAGSGDVSKVGTPADNQIGVWTGDGTIEGTSDFTFDGADFIFYNAVNDGNPELRLGAADAEEFHIQTVFDTGAQTLDYVLFQTDVASATADKGLFRFNVDGSNILDINDGGLQVTGNVSVTDDAYAVDWNGSTDVPTKNAVYDKIETLGSGGLTIGDAITGGTNDRILYQASGNLAQSADLTFNGTVLAVGREVTITSGNAGYALEVQNTQTGNTDEGLRVYTKANSGGDSGKYALSIETGATPVRKFSVTTTGVVTSHGNLNADGDILVNSDVIHLDKVGNNGRPEIKLKSGTDVDSFRIHENGYWHLGTTSTLQMRFGANARANQLHLATDGKVGIETHPTAPFDVNGDHIRVRTSKTPASASATGNQGDIAWDSSYIYVCTAANTWKRAALSTW